VPNEPFSELLGPSVPIHEARRRAANVAADAYAAALREDAGAVRFMLLCIACEALETPLRKSKLDPAKTGDGWYALKAVAARVGIDPAEISQAASRRNDLTHLRPRR